MGLSEWLIASTSEGPYIRWGKFASLTVGGTLTTFLLGNLQVSFAVVESIRSVLGGFASWLGELIVAALTWPGDVFGTALGESLAFLDSLGILAAPVGFVIVLGALTLWERIA